MFENQIRRVTVADLYASIELQEALLEVLAEQIIRTAPEGAASLDRLKRATLERLHPERRFLPGSVNSNIESDVRRTAIERTERFFERLGRGASNR